MFGSSQKRISDMGIPEPRKSPNQATERELNLLLPKEAFELPLWEFLSSSIHEALFPKKEAPLVLTSKPLETGEMLGDSTSLNGL
jgi:hypothetical protein